MAEAVLALPPPYLWLERSLHVKPREIESDLDVFGPGNDEIVGNRRLLRVGEKVKGQIPSRKKPY